MPRLGLLWFLWGSLSIAGDFLTQRNDSGIYGPKYGEILSWMDRLSATYPRLVTVIDYGKSVKGRTLRLFVVKRGVSPTSLRPTILMSGSTHGNEYLNIEDRLPEEILKSIGKQTTFDRFLDLGGVFIFIPILNPDGYTDRSRFNANGIDLNRDWDVPTVGHKGFSQAETRQLKEILERLRRELRLNLQITIDYHCCAGALLHPWSHKINTMNKLDLDRHREVGRLGDKHLNLEIGATGQVLGYYPMGTTKDYYFDRYGAVAFTYEGRYAVEDKKLLLHLSWWQDMVGHLVAKTKLPLKIVKLAPLPTLLP